MTGFDDDPSTRHARVDELHRLRLTSAHVEVRSGPEDGTKVDIGPAGLLVGSGLQADLRLTDKLLSRKHVRLRADASGVLVEDLDSLNGTFLGEARLGRVQLSTGTVLTVGGTKLAVVIDKQPLDLAISRRDRFGDAIGTGGAMKHVFAMLEPAAQTDVTVLLEGESGVGKDVLARALHQEGARRDGPFVVVDCGAIPENLVESELFGHERGAFTGAVGTRVGAFEEANGGTVFLDEIGELPIEAQPKLLRALEARSFRRVGGSQSIQVDVRVIAATNRRLKEAVRQKEFREDLFYRLAVVHVEVPPLRDRPEDIIPIAEGFLKRLRPDATIPEDVQALLMAFPWQGNARELRNVVERFATFQTSDESVLFGSRSAERSADDGELWKRLERMPYHDAKRLLLEEFHREVLPKALARCDGSVARAAALLELPRQSLHRMLKDLDPAD